MRQKQNWFRRTEAELFNYPIRKARVEQIEDELSTLEPRQVASYKGKEYPEEEVKIPYAIDPDTIPGGGLDSETERLVIEREDLQKEKKELLALVAPIEKALNKMTDEEKAIFEAKYIKGHEPPEIYEKIVHMGKTKYYLVLKILVAKTAFVLGFLKNPNYTRTITELRLNYNRKIPEPKTAKSVV